MKRLLISFAILGFWLGGHALSADLSEPNGVIAPSVSGAQGHDWSGFFVGVQGGYGWANGEIDDDPGPGTSFDPLVPEWDMDGLFAGGIVGFNYQLGYWVGGIEADINYSDISGSNVVGLATLSGEIDWFGSVRARAGYAMDRTLLFAAGGVAFADGSHVQSTSASDGGTFTGWTIGGGVEHAFSDSLSVRADYRYYDFGDIFLDGLGGPFTDRDYEITMHTVSLGLSYGF